jgi:hypothetical protein
MIRFVNILPKVDFPEPLGPVIMTDIAFEFDSFANLAISLFHSGGDTSSCSAARLGTSAAENSYTRYQKAGHSELIALNN